MNISRNLTQNVTLRSFWQPCTLFRTHEQLKVKHVCQVVARGMVEQGKGGSIVHMSSVASKIVPQAGPSVYAAAKAALDSLAQAMALELGPHKVSMCLSP